MSDRSLSEIFFTKLEGEYESLEKFIGIFLACFNTHLAEFPPNYSYIQALSWGMSHGWVRREGKRVIVKYQRIYTYAI